MLLYAAFVVAAALWPFTFVAVCATCENQAVAGHGVSFPAGGLIRSLEPARALPDRLVASDSFTVEVRLTPARTRQVGPARIVGMSDGPFRRNFTLAQEGRDLVFRLRTSETDRNWLKNEAVLGGVFRAGEERHLVATWRSGAVELFVDGRRRAAFAGPAGRLNTWDPGYPLLLGNERSGDRPWLGTIDRVAIYDRVLSQTEILERYAASEAMPGPMSAPVFALAPRSAAVAAPFELEDSAAGLRLGAPARYRNEAERRPLGGGAGQPSGLATPFALMLPFGLLAGLWARGRTTGRRAALAAIVAAFALALACELLQTFAAERRSSVAGLAGGVLGGALGVLIAVQRTVPIGHGATGLGLVLRRAVGTALLLYLASCLALAAHIAWLERFAGPPRPARLIVVLGGGLDAGSGLSAGSRRRTEAGIALYAAGVAPRLHFTGGGSPGHRSDGELMRDLALASGVPPEAATAEGRSASTLENALFSREMLGSTEGPILLVSDPYHLARAWLLFRWAGYGPPVHTFAATSFGHWPPIAWPEIVAWEAAAWWVNLAKVAAWPVGRLVGAAAQAPEPAAVAGP
jgi:uncharacterized SAM-binding protein YcdF (DUF218 family)